MSASMPQKPGGEQGNSVFSYAQAAKGRSPSVPNTALDLEKPAAKRTASEGQAASVDEFKAHKDTDATTSTKNETSKTPPPLSSDLGIASTSIILKEDDPLALPISSSESTWDKQSQTSQNGIKDGDTAEARKQESNTTSWADDTPAPVSLRDAPPPPVNYWEQRKEIMQAKVRATKPAASQSNKGSDFSNPQDSLNSSKHSGVSAEAKRLDGQRKPKNNLASTELNTTSKDWSKSNDGKLKNGDEGMGKNDQKVRRVSESVKPIPLANVHLPPPGDAVSWPTPDSAQDEEKRRTQERAEKADRDKTAVPKPNSKKEWTAMAFVPSAVFSTPIPQSRRGGGGRPSRGSREAGTGRGGTVPQNSNGVEKTAGGAQGSVVGQSLASPNERSRAEPNTAKSAPNNSKPKRSASAGPPTVRDQRKTGESSTTERRKDAEAKPLRANAADVSGGIERNGSSIFTQTGKEGIGEPLVESSALDDQSLKQSFAREEGERRPNAPLDTHAHPRSAGAERRFDGPSRLVDHPKDLHGVSSARERSEVHRGRGGGYRSRNGGHAFTTPPFSSTQNFANGHTSHHQPSSTASTKSQSSHERHASQSHGLPYVQAQPHSKSYRSGSRSQSIPHPGSSYGRYLNGPYTGPPNLPNIQTDMANAYGYQPGHQGIMSAMPFSSFSEQAVVSVPGMVSMQMEYYFSVDNLCKDMYLRSHMDSQGYVFLSVLVKFNRIKQLTQDPELVRWVCLHSPHIEICTAADGIDRLRKKHGWDQWVLAMEERDPSARSDGPDQVEPPHIPQPMLSMPYGYDGVLEGVAPYSPPTQTVDDGPKQRSRNAVPQAFVPAAAPPMTNGTISGHSVTQTPLSAAVPDFAPSLPDANGQSFSPLDSSTHDASLFTDEQVESLVVVRKPTKEKAPQEPPFASASSRTFSNGSIDVRTMSEELPRLEDRQPSARINGTVAPDLDQSNLGLSSRSPFKLGSPKPQVNSNVSPILWVKNRDVPFNSLPEDLTHEPYHVFRANAVQQREQLPHEMCHDDMENLYQFWSHFLIRNFNPRMYREFRGMAYDDANNRKSSVGMQNLIQYYNESMLGQKTISDEIARDFVDLVRSEGSNGKRPAFEKLRQTWRNRQTNPKSRIRIESIIDAELKTELERGDKHENSESISIIHAGLKAQHEG